MDVFQGRGSCAADGGHRAVKSRTALAKYLFALLLFGSNGVIASRISLPSCEIVFFRTLIGSALLFVLLALTGKGLAALRRRAFLLLALSGACMGASWIFLFEAYRRIGVGTATLAYYCGPVIVMALSPLLFREKLTRRKLIGFAAVFAGGFLAEGQAGRGSGSGLFCGAMSAVFYACMVIAGKKAKGGSGLARTALQLASGFLTVAVYTGLREGFAFSVAPADWVPILLLGLVNTGIGCWLYFSSIEKLPVQTVSVCGYLEPLSAVAFAAIFLSERMSAPQLLGAALILGGAAFAETVRPAPAAA